MSGTEHSMTSNRVKAAARRLQAEHSLPYAEALRRILATSPGVAAPPPAHACRHGLNIADGDRRRKICPRCATDEQFDRVRAVHEAALQARILKPVSDAFGPWWGLDWPYGPNIDLDSREALVAWALPLDLRQSSAFVKCLHWLLGKRCPRPYTGDCSGMLPGADHTTIWNQGPGRNPVVIVTQPYGLRDEDRLVLAEIDARPEFQVEIDDNGGWYQTNTTWVAVWSADRH